MRSLSVRFTLAFLLLGIITVAFVGSQLFNQTRSDFDQFLLSRDRQSLLITLEDHYKLNGSWDGVSETLISNSFFENHTQGVVLLDTNGMFVFGDREELEESELNLQIPIQVEGLTVGTLLVEEEGLSTFESLSPEAEFLEDISASTLIILGIAIVFSLMLGSLLARSLSRPIIELTEASQKIASGDFDQQVPVRSKDELGKLAKSFNQMSKFVSESTRMRKQMSADIAHELRTPLSILRGYSEALMDGTLKGNKENYEIIHNEVLLLNHLVEDLRILSLSDSGELRLNKEQNSMSDLLDKLLRSHTRAAEEKGLHINLNIEPHLPNISFDQQRISQVLNNLLSNAIRFSDQGEITISAARQGDSLEITVKDSGQGILTEDLKHIFDRFFRADQSRQRSEEGSTGLGLAIARAIVEAHGGRISAHSELGMGTSISIFLPL